jgi:D-3-phosphoglycerate dehydrogenase
VSTCLAAARINIAELLNKSRGEYAYTLVDAEGTIGDDLLTKIRSIEGILTARIV